MFGFLKKNKDLDDENVTEYLSSGRSRFVCDENLFAGLACTLHFEKDRIRFEFDETEFIVEYSRIVSCGKFKNTKSDIRKAMESGVLSEAVMSSSGFLAGGFYTLSNTAKEFLFLKYKDEKNEKVIHTFLLVYNVGVDLALAVIKRRASKA